MRSALFALVASLAIATPAFAQPVYDDEPRYEDSDSAQEQIDGMADTLNDPRTQRAAGDALGAMIGAVMDMRIDGLSRALEPLNGGRRVMHGRTVRDLAAREDPYIEQDMRRGAQTAVRSAGSMASAVSVMLPELQRAIRKMSAALPNLQ